MTFRPRAFGGGEASSVAEEKVRQPMPGAEEIGADILAAAQQIARGFFLIARNVNRGERAGAVEDGELARIATVRFHAVAWTTRNQAGRDDVARNVPRGQRTLQFEPTRTGFVAAVDRALTPQALDEAQKRWTVRH